MRDIYLDKNGGLDFKTIIDRSDEVLQSIRIILETKLGEFIGDPELGLDRTDLLEKNFNARYATQAIHDALEQDNRIGVLSVEVVPDFYKRTALAKLTLTVDGEAKKTEVALNVG
ncbi:GPW/gp25 family protein [Weissella sagaensis]|uniref:GPW/gp25 family protein n=1 Tax=Weissella sagaensis TaxID=2559928 RepID=A0ABW1RS99_9LACO|nr:GPW/gp25 family protein [Weissella sagaensis]MBU7568199.1 hypothetical protein [Weissella hellenica]QDJ58126.1 hypothetical protein EFA59_00690 [Weissella hellenica]UEG66236.1 hypothetical protein GZH44_05465 [Weissella hellenica]